MKKLLTIGLLLTMLSMPSKGLTISDGVLVVSEGHLFRQNAPADIEFLNRGNWIQFGWGVPTGGCPGGVTYLWQQSNDGRTWVNAPGVNTERIYTTPPITADTYFRRLTTDDCGVTFSTTSVRVTLDRTVWATRNVDMPGTFAATPEDPGRFYQWNRRLSWAITGDVTGWNREAARGTVWERANDPCPPGWRVPTLAEFDRLQSHMHTGISSWNGVRGTVFGVPPYLIFLPSIRNRRTDGLPGIFYGGYWASEPRAAWRRAFDGTAAGLSVRCVKEDTSQLVTQSIQELSAMAASLDGVVINNIIWATRNVATPGTFTENPEDTGMFFQWNRLIGWSVNPLINSNGGRTWDDSNPTGSSWYRYNDPCPPGWRVPLQSELYSLSTAASTWTTKNGVNGRLFGTEPNQIFLPAVGHIYWGGLIAGDWGMYWSASQVATFDTAAMRLLIDSGRSFVHGGNNRNRLGGYSIRCVADN